MTLADAIAFEIGTSPNTKVAAVVRSLKPSQKEALLSAVHGNAIAFEKFLLGHGSSPTMEGSPIVISSDDFIIDGHHRWAAVRYLQVQGLIPMEHTIEALRIHGSAREILFASMNLPGTQFRDTKDNLVQFVRRGRLVCN